MKKEQLTPQKFLLHYNNQLYGCSFRKRKNTEYYLGQVSEYDDKEHFDNHMKMENKHFKNIKLGTTDKEQAQQQLINHITEHL